MFTRCFSRSCSLLAVSQRSCIPIYVLIETGGSLSHVRVRHPRAPSSLSLRGATLSVAHRRLVSTALPQGDIEDIDGQLCVSCPRHGYCFDMVSGELVVPRAVRLFADSPIFTYPSLSPAPRRHVPCAGHLSHQEWRTACPRHNRLTSIDLACVLPPYTSADARLPPIADPGVRLRLPCRPPAGRASTGDLPPPH